MNDNKKASFVFYESFYEAISELPDNFQLEMYNCVCRYALYGELSELSNFSKALFRMIKANIDAAKQKYQTSVENGKKGGRPKKPKQNPTKPSENPTKPNENPTKPSENPTKPNENLNVNVNVNDNVNVNVNDNVNVNENKNEDADDTVIITENSVSEFSVDDGDGVENTEEICVCLPVSGGAEYPVLQKDVDEWAQAYPMVNVRQELLRMRSWLRANPNQLRPQKKMPHFIVNWLSRNQNQADSHTQSAKPAKPANAESGIGFDLDEFFHAATLEGRESREKERQASYEEEWRVP